MRTRLQTRFTREYGVTYPMAQAAMAFGGTSPALAIAVCQARGVGSLTVTLEQIETEIQGAT